MTPAGRVIPFHRPTVVGREMEYLADCVATGSLAGDGKYTRRCAELLQDAFRIRRVIMTHSGTSALDVAARAIGLGPGDEVILPSFTFVATANAVVACGARPVFVDIRPDTLNLDESLIEAAITSRTKAIFPVHYAGCSCEMDVILDIANRHGLLVVEDAAQGVNAKYRGKPLGTLGHLGIYSFHEAKNVVGGQVGAVCVNDPRFDDAVEIVRDKGTNRGQLVRGEVPFYSWHGIGSAHGPSELCCAYLCAQLEELESIEAKRAGVFARYWEALFPEQELGFELPKWPEYCQTNHHIFYFVLATHEARERCLAHLRAENVAAQFHYVPLHTSPMGSRFGYREGMLPVTESLAARLVRLPLYNDLNEQDQDFVVDRFRAYLVRESQGIAVAMPRTL